jgi:hypothetical protein
MYVLLAEASAAAAATGTAEPPTAAAGVSASPAAHGAPPAATNAENGNNVASSSSNFDSSIPWHELPFADLRQQVFDDVLPWASNVSADASLHPQLQRIKQQMGMVAFELRAADQELRLVSFEMDSYERSIELERSELTAAIDAQSAALSQTYSELERLDGMLANASMPQQYQVHCSMQRAEMAASAAGARMLMLQQKLDTAVHMQSVAAASFYQYRGSVGSSAAAAVGAAAAFADELAAEGNSGDCGSDSEEGDVCSDDGEPCDEAAAAPAAAAAAPAAADTATPPPVTGHARAAAGCRSGVAAEHGTVASKQAGGQGTTAFMPLQPIKQCLQPLGPDALVSGPLRQRPWGAQVRYHVIGAITMLRSSVLPWRERWVQAAW